MRGAGFGYIVGRFFEKPCRFLASDVAVGGVRDKASFFECGVYFLTLNVAVQKQEAF